MVAGQSDHQRHGARGCDAGPVLRSKRQSAHCAAADTANENDTLDLTEQLGDAFLAQQQDVLGAVQKLHADARAAGNLQSTPHQVVTTMSAPAGSTASSPQQAMVIEPVNPHSYYIPICNPAVVFGAWAYPDYPPFY